jgi:hypothetical protein
MSEIKQTAGQTSQKRGHLNATCKDGIIATITLKPVLIEEGHMKVVCLMVIIHLQFIFTHFKFHYNSRSPVQLPAPPADGS